MLTLLTFIGVQILQKVSICCGWFQFHCVCYYVNVQFHLEEWSVDNSMLSKIWVEMCSSINLGLLQFKMQGRFQKRGLWMPDCQCIRTHLEEKRLKFVTLQSPVFWVLSRRDFGFVILQSLVFEYFSVGISVRNLHHMCCIHLKQPYKTITEKEWKILTRGRVKRNAWSKWTLDPYALN